jgi:hypothetical protein
MMIVIEASEFQNDELKLRTFDFRVVDAWNLYDYTPCLTFAHVRGFHASENHEDTDFGHTPPLIHIALIRAFKPTKANQ